MSAGTPRRRYAVVFDGATGERELRLEPITTDGDLGALVACANRIYPDLPRTAGDWTREFRRHGAALTVTGAWVGDELGGYLQAILDREENILHVEISVLSSADPQVTCLLDHAATGAALRSGVGRMRAGVLGDGSLYDHWMRRGFSLVQRYRRLALELSAEDPPTPAVIDVRLLGPDDPFSRQAHVMYADGVRDQPGSGTPAGFDEWSDNAGGAIRILGLEQGRPIGIASLHVTQARPTTAFHSLTTVHRDARGRGLGNHFKAAVVGWARDAGYTRLETASDESNAPMRAINAALGFQALPDVVIFESAPLHSDAVETSPASSAPA